MKKLIVILAAIAMVGAFTATTMAAEWNFYGSARMATFYTSDDPGNDADSIDNFNHDLQGNARIGANVKASDAIGGRFEYGHSSSASNVGLRMLYGTYNFGMGEVLVGQTYTPLTSFYSNSVFDGDGDLLGVGQFYEGRLPMVQLKMAGFKVALIKPNVASTLEGTASTEAKMPKIEASYGFKFDNFFADAFAGYQTYDEKGTIIGDQSVDSWVVGIGGGMSLGPFYGNIGVHYSINQGQYGAYNPGNAGPMADEAQIVGGEVKDNKGYGYLAVVGFKAGDKFTIEAGYGNETNELDIDNSNKDETDQYYLNLTWNIAPGFFVVPEVGFIDRKDNAQGNDQGDLTYYGLKWQINF